MMHIPIFRLAEELGLDRSSLLKFIKKSGFQIITLPRTLGSRGQAVSALTNEDAALVRKLRGCGVEHQKEMAPSDLQGYFYAIQIIPEFVSIRVRLGFTSDVSAQLVAVRVSAPTAMLLKLWRCRPAWQAAVIDSITRSGSKMILGEIYEFDSVEEMLLRADAFFTLMPVDPTP